MKKSLERIVSVVLLCAIVFGLNLFIPTKVSAYGETEQTSGDFKFIVRNGEALITGYSGSNKALIIPTTVNGYKVTAVGDYQHPYGVPLSGVEQITSFHVGGNVRVIANSALKSAKCLQSININYGVKQIGWTAFGGCTELTTVIISNSVIAIGASAFDNTAWYNNQPNGVIYAGNVAVGYKGNMPASYTLNLKSGTVGIATYAFSNQSNLTAINTSNTNDSLVYIGRNAFDNTNWLSNHSNGIVYIGKVIYTYKGVIPSEVSIVDGTLGIAEYAFCDYELHYSNSNSSANLSKVTIPEGLIAIGGGAFANCWHLVTLTVPDSVTFMDYDCFGFHNAYKGSLTKSTETKDQLVIQGCKGGEAERYARETEIVFKKTFSVNRDGNRFIHSDGKRQDGTFVSGDDPVVGYLGFWGVGNYEIESQMLRAQLINLTTSSSETGEILKQLESPWGGSCYGVASVIGLVYQDVISLNEIKSGELSDQNADCFYKITRPCQNQSLLDAIQYYHITQYLSNYGEKSSKAISTYFDVYKRIYNSNSYSNIKTNNQFFESLISDAKSNDNLILCYSEKNGSGHAVLVCGVEETGNTYKIKVFDENDFDINNGNCFDDLIIRKNGSNYSAQYICNRTGDTNLMNELVAMDYLPLSVLYPLHIQNSKKDIASTGANSISYITVPVNQRFIATNDSNDFIQFNGSDFNTNMTIYQVQNIHNNGKDYLRFKVDLANELHFTFFDNNSDVTVMYNDKYYSLSGNGIDTAHVDYQKGIQLIGDSFDFQTFVNRIDESGEIELASITGSADNQAKVYVNKYNKISVSSNSGVNDLDIDLITEDNRYSVVDNTNIKNYTVSEEHITGDADYDSNITIMDTTLIQYYLANMADEYDIDLLCSDVDSNNDIEIVDATYIQRYVAGMINNFGQPESVSLNYTSKQMNVGDTFTLKANISPSQVMYSDIAWTSSNKNVATVNNGVVTAKAAGTATITASTYNGKTAKCNITVVSKPTSISLNKNEVTLHVDESVQLTASLKPSGITDTISWTSQYSNYASVSNNGYVYANRVGDTIITAKTSNGLTATCTVHVVPKSPLAVFIDKEALSIDKGEGYQLSASVSPQDADQTISWSSSDTNIATINSSGYITGVKSGRVSITARASNGISDTCEVEVYQPISGYMALVLFTKNEPNGFVRITKDFTVNLLNNETDITAFCGVINGDFHTITYSYEYKTKDTSGDCYRALIPKTDGALIKNITVSGNFDHDFYPTASNKSYCAGVVAYAKNTTFENCFNQAKIENAIMGSNSGYAYTGGITAWGDNCVFKDCKNSGNILTVSMPSKVSASVAGGIVGVINGGSIESCISTGGIGTHATNSSSIYYTIAYSGGIVGQSYSATINSCSSSGNVNANSWPDQETQYKSVAATGGIVGAGTANILNSASTCILRPSGIRGSENYSNELIGYEFS